MNLQTLSAALCPLCGQANRCAMEQAAVTGAPAAPCWCARVDFSAELLARVPPEAQRRACICEACVRAQLPAGER